MGGARVNATAAGSRHSCPVSQSVGPERVWPRDRRRRSPADFPLGGHNAPPGSRLLTDITCATADQPACHVIATTAAHIPSDRRAACTIDLHRVFRKHWKTIIIIFSLRNLILIFYTIIFAKSVKLYFHFSCLRVYL